MKELIKNLISNLPQETRKLDIKLIQSFVDDNDEEVIESLKKYQNNDGGFGHGLEADTTLPDSSVVNTNMAVNILETLNPSKSKDRMLHEIIAYFERTFNPTIQGWKMVPKSVDDYPRAIWWNYESLDSFPWQNPNLEIIGFLNQNKDRIKTLDMDQLTSFAINRLFELNIDNCSMHTLLSAVRFYERVNQNIKNQIFSHLDNLVNQLVEFEPSNWNEYVLEPYKVLAISKDFMKKQQNMVQLNIEKVHNLLNESYPLPTWDWVQYQEVFSKQKFQWIGNLAFEMLQALSNFN